MTSQKNIIVSMTTTAKRTPFLERTLSSIQCQTVKPSSIQINIPSSYLRPELETVDVDSIPDGFTIFRCDDYGPATKLLPTLKRYEQQDVVIIYCDDDRIYAPNWIERLLTVHEENGGCCVGDEMYDIPSYVNSLSMAKTTAYRLNRILSLGMWSPRKRNTARGVILEGYGGVLVRPSFFDETVFNMPKEFFPVDDIWFSAKLAERGIPIKYSGRKPAEKSHPVIVNGADVGRMDGSLTTATFDGRARAELDINAMRYAVKNLGVWGEWEKHLQKYAYS